MKNEILFEFRTIGQYVKVSAIDPQTKTEVQLVGSVRSSVEELKIVATNKLLYVLKKKNLIK